LSRAITNDVPSHVFSYPRLRLYFWNYI